jgi:trans-feruloyl-CoA hydratase/vanillin synthase
MDSQPERVRDEVREKSRQWRNEILRNMPQPVIAKINGWVFGGGFTVVTGCDIAIAADDVQFGLSEVNFGHFPGGEVTIVLTEHLQPKHGLYYALTGKTMTAKEAERIGLITKAVPRRPRQRGYGDRQQRRRKLRPLSTPKKLALHFYPTRTSRMRYR